MSLTVIILTKNEERHIERALASVSGIANRCVVIDSGSTDRTCDLARAMGATVLERTWVNYADQFNWGISQLPDDTEWILRLDADEYITDRLRKEIQDKLYKLPIDIDGVYVSRRMKFLRKPIRWGGVFPIRILRIFRYDRGWCEIRWMDEHIKIEGSAAEFGGEIIDDNQNSLTWWIEKHNSYASREVVDLLNLEFRFMGHETVADLTGWRQVGVKRWLKERVYANLPIGLRSFLYFLYRYVFRLGFLDGREGAAFHILQGFWYRYLVDIKIHEVKTYMHTENVDVKKAIREILKIDLDK